MSTHDPAGTPAPQPDEAQTPDAELSEDQLDDAAGGFFTAAQKKAQQAAKMSSRMTKMAHDATQSVIDNLK